MAPKQHRSMDVTAVRCLINSVSRFIHLVKCSTTKGMPTQKEYTHICCFLKLLKPLLDYVVDGKVPSDEILCKDCEELDIAVNEAREYLEKWSPKMSKILCIVQSEQLLKDIQKSMIKISQTLFGSLESASSTGLSDIQEFQHLEMGKASHFIEEALARQRKGKVPSPEHVMLIIESLNLTSNEVFLNESVALEKERMKSEDNKMKASLDEIDLIVDLLSYIRDRILENFKSVSGTKVPPYFLCPLSLELMEDPVTVASGQTYDRRSIQKWVDQGLNVCPNTRENLSQCNLIPNYTVKALISNWCEENNTKACITLDCPGGVLIQSKSAGSPLGNSPLGTSTAVGYGSDKRIDRAFGLSGEQLLVGQFKEAEKSDNSPTHSYVHSRSGSTSSAVSSIEYLPPVSPDTSKAAEMLSTDNNGCPPTLSGRKSHISRSLSLPSESEFNDLTTAAHVESLIKDLKSEMADLQSKAAAELRFLAKHINENRVIIGNCGAIEPLISLLLSDVKQVQEHAVTALLNLSINEKLKSRIAECGALEPLIHVLRTGNDVSKENAAACLFSLSVLEEYRTKIGRSAAVKGLVDLLGSGTIRGKKDAATALFNLSIFHENKARIVQAGAVKHLVHLLDPEKVMVDKAVALLANLSTVNEGCSAIVREGGIPMLVEIVETGSSRGKENSASILLQLCINSSKHCRLVLQEGAVPPLVALSQSGTTRAKEKVNILPLLSSLAFSSQLIPLYNLIDSFQDVLSIFEMPTLFYKAQQLLSHFRSQREGAMGR